ncbi:Helix-turn-helix [Sphingopyxis sp. YR583]|uniref:helix-turn-helix domain-containing protein n=1 Tax=Sphingopyxis sp. YR583 TaxID=1881047 RepID=UPI0008A7C5B1|nr:helix-turn-helix domain-containing protein [Sphingopyxis sp. YR583]SEH19111.1 Helix-turn-helix [Sphingopyxis sp. YR583]
MTDFPIDWRAVVDEAIRRRKEEGFTQRQLALIAGVSVPTVNSFEQGETGLQFERVILILEALGLFLRPSAPDSLGAFVHKARRRWEELASSLPENHPARQPFGHSEYAYAIQGIRTPGLRVLRKALADLSSHSGLAPFWIPPRREAHIEPETDIMEYWAAEGNANQHILDAANSDFWQLDGEGQVYLQRGYQEDGRGNLEPGTIFDLTSPIRRTAEFLLFAAGTARLFGGDSKAGIHLTARYTGLEGRTLLSWTQPLLRIALEQHHRARTSRVDLDIVTDVGAVESDLVSLTETFLVPLYERFDGYRLPTDLVAAQIRELPNR